MGLQKGMTNNPEGRPVGSKNEKTKQWEKLAEDFIGRHTERFNRALDNLPDEDFIKVYIMVLSYFRPKLAAEKIEINETNQIKAIKLVEVQQEALKSFFNPIKKRDD